MPKLPKAREVEKVIKILGFKFSRQSGSHAIYKNENAYHVVIPIHGGKTISPGVFVSILKDLKIDKREFWNLL